MDTRGTSDKQTGFALPVALVLLVIIVLISLSAVDFSTLELHQAGNDATITIARDAAQSVVDATIGDADNTPVIGSAGYTLCTKGINNCDSYKLNLATDTYNTDIDSGDVVIEVERLAPALRPPPRSIGTSVAKFSAAGFSVAGSYDKSTVGLGESQIEEGIIILVPKL
ncbi:hypothetical protein GYB61_07775 [bacterium]|nr:hypothetical protein [bacterium]